MQDKIAQIRASINAAYAQKLNTQQVSVTINTKAQPPTIPPPLPPPNCPVPSFPEENYNILLGRMKFDSDHHNSC